MLCRFGPEPGCICETPWGHVMVILGSCSDRGVSEFHARRGAWRLPGGPGDRGGE